MGQFELSVGINWLASVSAELTFLSFLYDTNLRSSSPKLVSKVFVSYGTRCVRLVGRGVATKSFLCKRGLVESVTVLKGVQ